MWKAAVECFANVSWSVWIGPIRFSFKASYLHLSLFTKVSLAFFSSKKESETKHFRQTRIDFSDLLSSSSFTNFQPGQMSRLQLHHFPSSVSFLEQHEEVASCFHVPSDMTLMPPPSPHPSILRSQTWKASVPAALPEQPSGAIRKTLLDSAGMIFSINLWQCSMIWKYNTDTDLQVTVPSHPTS